jgi:vacuolar-type H+-ATPase subunit E/Vma4
MEEGVELPDAKGKGMVGKVFQWVFLISTALGVVTQYVHPEWLADATTEAVIHNDVEELKEEVEADLILKFQDKMDKADNEHNQCLSKIARLNTKIESLQSQIKSYDSILEGLEKHAQFNTLMSSITNEALIEEMDKRNRECNYIYYETNQKDNWGIFDDWYNSRVLYSLELKSDCRVYYTPIFREKVKIQ